MVRCIIDPAVIRIDQPFRPPLFPEGIDVAFMVVSIRQYSLIISETVAAYAHPRGILFQRSAGPPPGSGFFFGHEIVGEVAIGMQIEGNILFCRVDTVLIDVRPGLLCIPAFFRRIFICQIIFIIVFVVILIPGAGPLPFRASARLPVFFRSGFFFLR